MAYQGTADLAAMANDIAANIINGNWSDAIAEIRKLNGLQAVYLMDLLEAPRMISVEDSQRLAAIVSNTMNDGETGKGYISENQLDDEEE